MGIGAKPQKLESRFFFFLQKKRDSSLDQLIDAFGIKSLKMLFMRGFSPFQ
jgi:hypothetical protein